MTYNPSAVLTTKMLNDFDCCDSGATEQLQMLSSEIYQKKHTVKTLKRTPAYKAASKYFEFEDFYLQTLINIIL
tara:strand:- start:303 stop:524 length:222 start_codon:yes stop_codon:yes gene_type:complete